MASGEEPQPASSLASRATGALLGRPFKVIVFDWEGAAMAGRRGDAALLACLAERLLRRGVWLVAVAEARLERLGRLLCHSLPPVVRRRLLLCTSGGSEIYGFDSQGRLRRRFHRLATPEEESKLSAIAEALRDYVAARTGLEVEVSHRWPLRRRIDLMPQPEWRDQPLSGELLAAADEHLRSAGLAGGLEELGPYALRLAAQHGLPHVRVTSNARHIDLRLTDKGELAAWLRKELLAPERISPNDVLIVGFQFGSLAGLPGDDDALRPPLRGATAVSVGPEPTGVPESVLPLDGGPPRFYDLLAEQVWLRQRPARRGQARRRLQQWAEGALTPPEAREWALVEVGYDPTLERRREARLAVSNGFLGVRGSLEDPTAASTPRTYIAGLFDRNHPELGVPGLVPGPDWLRLRLYQSGQRLSIERGEILNYYRALDFRRGLLISEWQQRDADGRLARVRTLRLASQALRPLALQLAEVETGQPAAATLEAALGSPPDGLRLEEAEGGLSLWRTEPAGRPLAVATAAGLTVEGDRRLCGSEEEGLRRRWRWLAMPGERAIFWRLATFARDEGAVEAARATLERARRLGPRRLLQEHVRAWAQRWDDSDIVIEGDREAQRALRFAIYHLISAANPEDEGVSIGARALTGDAYMGHVFWDTDIFLLPFYIFTWPRAARAHLMYRYHTLPAARVKAASLGYRGALYAWESTDIGAEATPPYIAWPDGHVIRVLSGLQEHHISADVAYAVWQYWLATGDSDFLLRAGAEILLETARFWASRARLEEDGLYHIRGVVGPDEYHETVDDNAYTNVMAQWNLERGLEVAALLRRRWPAVWRQLRKRLELTEEELQAWREVAERLVTGFDPVSGLFEQFTGYFKLEAVDLSRYERRTLPMDVILGRDATQRSQVIKQADVVMLLALLWERFPPQVREANFHYYEPRCSHGSSLSPAIHALVAARLGELGLALKYFQRATAIDLDDTMGNTAEGVHIGALGGVWQATVFGFGGLTITPRGPCLQPRLPPGWQTMTFPFYWGGRRLRARVQARPASVTVTLERGRPLTVWVGGEGRRLRRGESVTFPLG